LSFLRKGQEKVSHDLASNAWLGEKIVFCPFYQYFSHNKCLLCFLLYQVPDLWVLTSNSTVPLVAVFTKFDGQIINEYVNLAVTENEDKWEKARNNAESTFQQVYLPRVLDAANPPRAYVQLEGENT